MTAIAQILAVRMLLLLAGIGAFILALKATDEPDFTRLAALLIFCCVVVLPLIWLDALARRGGPRGG